MSLRDYTIIVCYTNKLDIDKKRIFGKTQYYE